MFKVLVLCNLWNNSYFLIPINFFSKTWSEKFKDSGEFKNNLVIMLLDFSPVLLTLELDNVDCKSHCVALNCRLWYWIKNITVYRIPEIFQLIISSCLRLRSKLLHDFKLASV